MAKSALSPRELTQVLESYLEGLSEAREVVNSLNVYPVPDGDTGTNMLSTLRAVEAELELLREKSTAEPTMAEVCEAISKGSLMGARGNSGVILCQLLRGLGEVFALGSSIGPIELADALAAGNDAARTAVLRPVEGTILTVARGAAEEATNEASKGNDLQSVAVAARKGAKRALWSTPELLEVLAEAHVVDAGGAGLLLLFDAFVAVIAEQQREKLALPEGMVGRVESKALEGFDEAVAVPGGQAYEVMYLLEAPDDTLALFKDRWAEIGDSIVVVGDKGLFKCHIHTNDIGAAIEVALEVGRPRDIKVTDLREQVAEESWVEQAATDLGEHAVTGRTCVVAVASGEGIRRIFNSLGANGVISAGQSMNPSTKELLEMIDAMKSDEVVVLPNNANIIPVALEAAKLSDKTVEVVPTKWMQEGFAALLAFDPNEGATDNLAAMTGAASQVCAGEVTRAIRDATSGAGPIEQGDFIGISRSGIAAIEKTLSGASCRLIESMLLPEHEIVTLIEGAAVPAREMQAILEWLKQTRPDCSIERHYGGQPLYPLLISLE